MLMKREDWKGLERLFGMTIGKTQRLDTERFLRLRQGMGCDAPEWFIWQARASASTVVKTKRGSVYNIQQGRVRCKRKLRRLGGGIWEG